MMLKLAISLVQVTKQVTLVDMEGMDHLHHPKRSTENPANVSIVNEYNSFKLTNVIPPVAPKWKQRDTLLNEFRKF